MKQLSDFDKNFRIDTKISRDNLQFYNVSKKPFRIYGFLRENGWFCRMPHNVAEKVNESVSNWGEDWDLCTVDGVHPNDLGFYRMAMRIEKELIRICTK